MAEDEKQKMSDSMKLLLEALYNLSFANPLMIAMEQLEGRHVLLAEEAYSEIFDNSLVRPYFSLFLSGDDKGNLKLTSFGQALKTFRGHIHNLFTNEDFVARANSSFGIKLSNVVKDFVYSAISQLDEKAKMCIRVAADRFYYMRFDDAKRRLKEEFNVEIGEDEFQEKVRELHELLLSSSSTEVSPPELFKPYIMEATAGLVGQEKNE